MTDNAWAMLFTALPPTLAAIGALIVVLRNHEQNKTIEAKTDAIHTQNTNLQTQGDALAVTAHEIHLMVNSRMDDMAAQLLRVQERLDGAHAQIVTLVEERGLREQEIKAQGAEIKDLKGEFETDDPE